MNYYIIQVATGREQAFIDNLNKLTPQLAQAHNFIYLTRELFIRRFDENDRIVVIEGPLKGFEGSIIKVDRRKHRAKIQVDFAGNAHTMDLSFEDIEKKG